MTKRLRNVLHDETLLGMFAKALGYDVPTRAEASVNNAVADIMNKQDAEKETAV